MTEPTEGMGLQIANALEADSFVVLVGSRTIEPGEFAPKSIGADVSLVPLDVTDQTSIVATTVWGSRRSARRR